MEMTVPEKLTTPERPVARGDKPGTPLWRPPTGSKALMRAQAAAMRSIERTVVAVKKERERVARERRNSED
jgi:hypothetical protein